MIFNSSSIQINKCSAVADVRPFGHNRHGPKIGCVPLLGLLDSHVTNVAWANA